METVYIETLTLLAYSYEKKLYGCMATWGSTGLAKDGLNRWRLLAVRVTLDPSAHQIRLIGRSTQTQQGLSPIAALFATRQVDHLCW
jgi:hypothetical protein